jgi:hypothetical protein
MVLNRTRAVESDEKSHKTTVSMLRDLLCEYGIQKEYVILHANGILWSLVAVDSSDRKPSHKSRHRSVLEISRANQTNI